jgi:hypothetical protein
MTEEERMELSLIEAEIIKNERKDAQKRSQETFENTEVDRILTIYEVMKWQKVNGFWEVVGGVVAVRCYYHVWSDILQEAVLVCEAQKKLRKEER